MVPVSINDNVITGILDSAAQVTVMDIACWEQVMGCPPLGETVNLTQADGTSTMKAHVVPSVAIRIGNYVTTLSIFVTKLADNLLLGLDFLLAAGAIVNLSDQTLTVPGSKVPIHISLSNRHSVELALVAQTIYIEPGGEATIPLKMTSSINSPRLLEPSCRWTELNMADTVLQVNKYPFVKAINHSDVGMKLKTGTVIGTLAEFQYVPPLVPKPSVRQLSRDITQELPDHVCELYERSSEGLPMAEQLKLKELLIEFADVFSQHDLDIGCYERIKHTIDTKDARPIRQRMRRTPFNFQAEEEKHLNKLLNIGVIEPSSSDWAAAPVLIRKTDGSVRYAIDYRALNNVTVKDAFPLPLIEDCFDSLEGVKYFSGLDMASGYYQLEVAERDKPKTAFITRYGLFQHSRMGFGLCNAPATFQRAMQTVLKGLNWKEVLAYLDDIIVLGTTFESHLANLALVFQRFRVNNLKLKPRKCELFRHQLKFLGWIVSNHGIAIPPENIDAIISRPHPQIEIMSPLNPGPNLANMPQHRKVAHSEETSVYSPGRVARTHRQVQNCREQYAPPDIHDRPLMIPSPDSSNMSPYQNDTYSEEIDAYRDMTDIRREVEQCSDLYAPLNPHIRPPMDSTPYPANMHSYKNVKFLEVAAANAQKHPADVYMEGEQPIDHYTYPKSHIRPPIAPCQNPANMIPQTNAKCHEKDAVNVPRQVDIRDDQVNDYHEYPQSHVRPPRVLGPKPTNMSPLPNNSKYPGEAYTYVQGRHVDIHGEIESHNDHYGPPNHRVRPSKAPSPNPANRPLYSNVHKYPGDVHTYAQGHQADTHGKVEPRSNHVDPFNPHVRPPVSSDPNSTNLLIYTQNDAQLEDTFVNIAQQMVSLNLYEQCSPYKVSHCTQRSLVPPKMDNLDSHVTSSSVTPTIKTLSLCELLKMAPIPQSSHAMLHVSVKDESIPETPDFVAQSTAMGSQSVKQTISNPPRREVVKLIPGDETDLMTAPVVPSVKVKMNSFVTSSYDKLTDSPLLLSPADTTLDLRKQTWTIPNFLPGDLVPPWWDASPYLAPRYSVPTQRHLHSLEWHTIPLYIFVSSFLPGYLVPPWWDASTYLAPRNSVPAQTHLPIEWHPIPLYLLVSSFLPGELVPPRWDANPYLAFP